MGKKGSLIAIVGPVCAAKSIQLLQQVGELKALKKKFQLFTPDTREGPGVISSRISQLNGGDVIRVQGVYTPTAQDIIANLEPDTQVLGIDEAHFYDGELVGVCEQLLYEGRTIISSGLDFDYTGRHFPFGGEGDRNMSHLLALATEIIQVTARCTYENGSNNYCGERATMTQRFDDDGNCYPPEENVVEVSYNFHPRCEEHFDRTLYQHLYEE